MVEPANIDEFLPQLAMSQKLPDYSMTLTKEDASSYSLCIGLAVNPTNRKELKFAYSESSKFEIFPTATDIISNKSMKDMLMVAGIPSYLSTNDF